LARPLRLPTAARSVARGLARTRNLERRSQAGKAGFCGVYSGNPQTAAGGGGACSLTFDTLVSGNAVLTTGAVNKTGNWAITAVVSPTAGTGFPTASEFYAQMDWVDTASSSDGQAAFNSGVATAIHPTPPVTLGLTMWLAAGSTYTILVTNGAAANVDFEIPVATIAFLSG